MVLSLVISAKQFLTERKTLFYSIYSTFLHFVLESASNKASSLTKPGENIILLFFQFL